MSMNKAFIFDMDGVLVDSERHWEPLEEPFLKKIFGEKVAGELGSLVGVGLDGVYKKAIELGANVDWNEFLRGYEEVAMRVYDAAAITKGLDELVQRLIELEFKIGLVTQSPRTWVNRVLPQLSFENKLEVVLSLKERPDLKGKPEPDGFLAALKTLDADPQRSIVLEDSNFGIQAAKAAGCYVVAFRGNLVEGYEQTGADAYADTMGDVIKLVENREKKDSP